MPKPLRCRLRFHAWEDRENPETRDRYQVCVRCNAYRDRGSAAPGAGAAGVTGSGLGYSATAERGRHAVAWEKSALWFGCLPAIASSPCPQL